MNHCLIGGCKPPYHFANLTDQEYFNLHGTLTSERIQALLDSKVAATRIEYLLQNAKCFPDPEQLDGVTDNLSTLAETAKHKFENLLLDGLSELPEITLESVSKFIEDSCHQAEANFKEETDVLHAELLQIAKDNTNTFKDSIDNINQAIEVCEGVAE